MEVTFRLTRIQRERAESIVRRGGLHHRYVYQGEIKSAGNLLGNIAKGKSDHPDLSLHDGAVIVYKGTQDSLFQSGGAGVLAYIASGVEDFCHNGFKLCPKVLTNEMHRYLPVLDATIRRPIERGFLWYEAKPPTENRFEVLLGWQ